MTITKVRVIRPKDRTSPVLAFANVELNGSVTLRDMRLLRSSEEGGAPRLKMPTKQSKSGVYRQLKAFASCLVDGDVAIHRIAVILDMDTKALKLTMPNHDIAQSGAYASYYRLTPEAYQKLYNQVMEEYSKMPEDGGDAA